MNRCTLHELRSSMTWTEIKPGQIWGWKEDPNNTGFFLKIAYATITGWMVTGGVDIPDEEIKRNYILLHESEEDRVEKMRMMLAKRHLP